MTTAFAAFVVAATLIVLLPGPDTLVVVRNIVQGGRRVGTLTALGVLTGLLVWVSAASLGLSALLGASKLGYLVLRLIGGAYLVFLGVQSLRARVGAFELEPASGRGRPILGRGFVAGMATDLLNPKVGVFFVTFLPAFVPRGHPVGSTTLYFGAIFVFETALYFAVLLMLAGRVTSWLQSPAIRRRLSRVTGAVLVGFGIRLAAG